MKKKGAVFVYLGAHYYMHVCVGFLHVWILTERKAESGLLSCIMALTYLEEQKFWIFA